MKCKLSLHPKDTIDLSLWSDLLILGSRSLGRMADNPLNCGTELALTHTHNHFLSVFLAPPTDKHFRIRQVKDGRYGQNMPKLVNMLTIEEKKKSKVSM